MRRRGVDLAFDHRPIEVFLAGKVPENKCLGDTRTVRDLTRGRSLEALLCKQARSDVENLLAPVSRRKAGLRGGHEESPLVSKYLLIREMGLVCQGRRSRGGTPCRVISFSSPSSDCLSMRGVNDLRERSNALLPQLPRPARTQRGRCRTSAIMDEYVTPNDNVRPAIPGHVPDDAARPGTSAWMGGIGSLAGENHQFSRSSAA